MPDPSELFRSQPGWVVVAVVLICAAAWVLRARVTAAARADDEPPESGPRTLAGVPVGGPGQTYDAIAAARDRLAEIATREAERGDRAEWERQRLEQQLDQALDDLAACERAAAGPIRDAWRYVDQRDPGPADAPRRRRRLDTSRDDLDPGGWRSRYPG